jgi:cold shock protein
MANLPPARAQVIVATAMTGRVIQVVRSRSCGFIRASDGQDVFFHASELEGVKLDGLEDGERVRFDMIRDAISGPRATRVRPDKPKAAKASKARPSA